MSKWTSLANINLKLAAESELETINAMLSLVKQNNDSINLKLLASDLLFHETVSPSATGNCAVIFRVLSEGIKRMQIFFGRFDEGIGYYSRSGHPIDLIFLIAAPPEESEIFYQYVDRIEKALNVKKVRERFRLVTDNQKAKIIIEDILNEK